MDVSMYSTSSHFPFWEGAKIRYFACNLRLVLRGNDKLWTIRGLQMLWETLSVMFIHHREVIEDFRTNWCLLMQHSNPILVLGWCFNVDILHEIWYLLSVKRTWCGQYWACICYINLFKSCLYISERSWHIQVAMHASPHSTASHFMCWEGTWNLIHFMKFESCYL